MTLLYSKVLSLCSSCYEHTSSLQALIVNQELSERELSLVVIINSKAESLEMQAPRSYAQLLICQLVTKILS